MVKKTIIWILFAGLIFTLCSCNLKQKAGNLLQEQVLENVLGNKVDIDLDDGEIRVTGEDGEEYVIGGGEWPQGKASAGLPRFSKGKITSVMNSDAYCLIMLEDASKKDWESYVAALQAEGFDQDITEYDSDGMSVFEGKNKKNDTVATSFSAGDGALSISLTVADS
ncbi:MAG: hypothetical protein GX112_04145 [Clostridiaceae bacterium]|jgi:hypothetical protein|nr:hypothetical protein [Clostridiaceae bacterium]